MTTFTIDTDNNIEAHAAARATRDNLASFASQKEFANALGEAPMARLAAIWNSLAGVAPVKKFENRSRALRRIWEAVQTLQPAPPAAPKPALKAKASKAATSNGATATGAAAASVPRAFSKKAIVADMLKRTGGASPEEIMSDTGWQKHTVRGFISTLAKKTRIVITSTRRKSDKARVYAAR